MRKLTEQGYISMWKGRNWCLKGINGERSRSVSSFMVDLGASTLDLNHS
ncbi:hypothetical protein ACFQ9Y_14685 [Peribacillus simplex]